MNQKIELLKEFVKFLNLDDTISNEKIIQFVNKKRSIESKNEDVINIYTDGACSANGKRYAKGGIGIYVQNTDTSISKSLEELINKIQPISIKKPTNNIAELLAIYYALKMYHSVLKDKKIVIHSDSKYAINCVNNWYKNWEKNNWMTSNGKPVVNKEIIQKILKYSKHPNVSFKHVPAHTNEPSINDSSYENWYGNFQADKLACQSLTYS